MECRIAMTVNWLELAQKVSQAARMGVVIVRKCLQEIFAQRQREAAISVFHAPLNRPGLTIIATQAAG